MDLLGWLPLLMAVALLGGVVRHLIHGRRVRPQLPAKPSGCHHRNTVPVTLLDGGETVARLCTDCGEQLFADWTPQTSTMASRAYWGVGAAAIAIPSSPAEMQELLSDEAHLQTFFTREAVSSGVTAEFLRRYSELCARERPPEKAKPLDVHRSSGQKSPKGTTRPPLVTTQQVTPPPSVYCRDNHNTEGAL